MAIGSAAVVILLWLWLRSPVPELDATTTTALEEAADRWWQPDGRSRDIPEAEWPPELRRLAPESVRTDPAGVFIKFGSRYVEEDGVFVLPTRGKFWPTEGGDPSFTLIRGRVYRYHIAG